jgi:hypothetical protein
LYIVDGFSIVECEKKRLLVWKNDFFGTENEEPYFCFNKKRDGQKMVRVQKSACPKGRRVEIGVVITERAAVEL